MFESLSDKLESAFKFLRSRATVTEKDIDEALVTIRTALLEADVNLQVTKKFCESVRKKSLGSKVMKSLTPAETILKIVQEELVKAIGERGELNLRTAPPVVLMLVGLQGSGKTTSCAKLAKHLRDDHKRRPLLIPADVYRPAAIEQLKTLGRSLDISVFDSDPQEKPVDIAKKALKHASLAGFDVAIIDTAGRLQIDGKLMNELAEIVESVEPHEILLVADAMTGQESVNVAKGFDKVLDIDGIILSKLDGDARGGAALSMRAITNKPIKFVGIGEKLDALEPFYPERMVSRILGMGDMLSFIEKASKEVDLDDAKKLQKKIKKNQFSFEDFYQQLQTIRRMGSVSSIMQMIPGMNKAAGKVDDQAAEKELKHIEAIILSMTKEERQDHEILNGSRRKRIALGSGRSVEDVNRLVKQFGDMKKIMKRMSKINPSMLRGLSSMMSKAGV